MLGHMPMLAMFMATTQVTSERIEPTERSKPPAQMAKVMPAAAMPVVAERESTVVRLDTDTILGLRARKTSPTASRIARMPKRSHHAQNLFVLSFICCHRPIFPRFRSRTP